MNNNTTLFPVPTGFNTNEEYLAELVRQSLDDRFNAENMELDGRKPNPLLEEQTRARATLELIYFQEHGLVETLLIASDLVRWAREKGLVILLGHPVSSVVAHLLELNPVNPLEISDELWGGTPDITRFNKAFLRFECSVGAPEMLREYLTQSYGHEHVAHVLSGTDHVCLHPKDRSFSLHAAALALSAAPLNSPFYTQGGRLILPITAEGAVKKGMIIFAFVTWLGLLPQIQQEHQELACELGHLALEKINLDDEMVYAETELPAWAAFAKEMNGGEQAEAFQDGEKPTCFKDLLMRLVMRRQSEERKFWAIDLVFAIQLNWAAHLATYTNGKRFEAGITKKEVNHEHA